MPRHLCAPRFCRLNHGLWDTGCAFADATHHRCFACGKLFSWGDSNDEPGGELGGDVALEIVAAEIVAGVGEFTKLHADPAEPKAGERWRGRSKTGGVETRTVRDRTLGRGVVYVVGKVRSRSRNGDRSQDERCSFSEWIAWSMFATRID